MPLPVPGAGKIYWGHGVRGFASPDPLLGAFRGEPAPQIMEVVEVFLLVPSAGELIVVCQCHRSCRYVEVASLYGVLPQVQFLDKVVDMPVAIGKPVEIPQVQFLDKLSTPVVGAWCSWPDSAENCGNAAVAVQIVASRATDHGEIVQVIQLLRRGADRGVSCHRSWR